MTKLSPLSLGPATSGRSRLFPALAVAAALAGCTAEAPDETNLAHNGVSSAGGKGGSSGSTSTGGAAGTGTAGSGGAVAGGASSTGGTASGGTGPGKSSVGNVCTSDADCTGYDHPSCLTQLQPLKGKITDPMNPQASNFENGLIMPFPNGYCTTTIENSCPNDAACGVGGGCFRGLDGVDKASLQMVDDTRKCAQSSTGKTNPGAAADGTMCSADSQCEGDYCDTFLPFSTVAFADTGICLLPCKTDDDCRKSEGYVCAVPMASLIGIINPMYTNTYCVGPFTFML